MKPSTNIGNTQVSNKRSPNKSKNPLYVLPLSRSRHDGGSQNETTLEYQNSRLREENQKPELLLTTLPGQCVGP